MLFSLLFVNHFLHLDGKAPAIAITIEIARAAKNSGGVIKISLIETGRIVGYQHQEEQDRRQARPQGNESYARRLDDELYQNRQGRAGEKRCLAEV